MTIYVLRHAIAEVRRQGHGKVVRLLFLHLHIEQILCMGINARQQIGAALRGDEVI